ERALIAAAAAAGVEVSALSDYWMDDSSVAPDDRAGLVLGFAAVPEARIDEALRALRKAWRREALVGPVVATD
ncbi:TPA: PLP-dependent aminotransferase family protein, partial [Pseudomonas aeruginosa]|nr:PLP-dependent aminotransferase family protein [Pseudomonas aeruginosa]HDU8988425.1 PLP-dependent aminotransferase family protein [Pseudomonas aeruginosa]HEP8501387.1 PLP-dependent aminotransferase family protein [Pseudomonas aeruginosa]